MRFPQLACIWQEDGLGTAGGGCDGGKEGGGGKGEGGGGEGGGIGDCGGCGGQNGASGGNCGGGGGGGGGGCTGGTLGGAGKSDAVPSQVASSSKSLAAQWHGPNGIPPTNARSAAKVAASWRNAIAFLKIVHHREECRATSALTKAPAMEFSVPDN